MPASLLQFIDIWRRLGLGQRIVIIGGGLITLAVIIALFVYGSQPDYGLLFTDLRPIDAQSMVEKLKAANVPYRLTNNGTSISVPSERVAELRLQMTAGGNLTGGHVGFDIFDRNSFGATDFTQQVNYQRALEGELARTLEAMDEIQSARVHITRSHESIFAEKVEPAKASVMLSLKNPQISRERIDAIVNLLSSAVEGLAIENVAVMDARGRLLAGTNERQTGLGALNSALELRQKIEADAGARVISLLEPLAGIGHVRANVNAELDLNQIEQTEEKYDPKSAVVRTQQLTQESKSNPSSIGGVTGARGNDPAAVPGATQTLAAPTGDGRSASTTTYEIDKVIKRVNTGGGQITRLSVSVLIDNNAPGTRTPEDLKKIQELTAAALGINPTRGDQLIVQMIPFNQPPTETPNLTWFERNKELVRVGLKYGVMVFIALLLIVFIIRPINRTLRNAAMPIPSTPLLTAGSMETYALPAGQLDKNGQLMETINQTANIAPRTVAELEAEVAKELATPESSLLKEARATVLKKKITQYSKEEPLKVAMTIRNWLQEK